MTRLTTRQLLVTAFAAVWLLGLAVLLQRADVSAWLAVPLFSAIVLGHLWAVVTFASVLGLLAPTGARAQNCNPVANTSCGTLRCCDIDRNGTRLYCTTDETAPYDGPARSGSCKRCEGSTFDATKCASAPPVTTTTTVRTTTTTSTTQPGGTTTTRPTVTTTSRPATTTTQPILTFTGLWAPYRPNECDLSLAWTDSQDGSVGREDAMKWCDICGVVHTCSEYERDVKEWTFVFAASEVDAALADVCPDASRGAWSASGFNAVYPRLGLGYEDRDLCKGNVCDEPLPAKPSGGGLWVVKVDGHHYSIEKGILREYRQCLTSTKNRATCQQRMAAAPALRMLLNLDTSCTGAHEVTQRIAHPKRLVKQKKLTYDSDRAQAHPVDSRPALVAKLKAQVNRPADLAALALVTGSHHKASGLPYAGDWIDVQLSMVRYEALCCAPGKPCDEDCLHFRVLKKFKGGCAPRWSAEQCRQWKALTHIPSHHEWGEGQRLGLWGPVRKDDSAHNNVHECMTEQNPALEVIFPCPEHPENPEQCAWGDERGAMTCQAYLPILVEKYLAGHVL